MRSVAALAAMTIATTVSISTTTAGAAIPCQLVAPAPYYVAGRIEKLGKKPVMLERWVVLTLLAKGRPYNGSDAYLLNPRQVVTPDMYTYTCTLQQLDTYPNGNPMATEVSESIGAVIALTAGNQEQPGWSGAKALIVNDMIGEETPYPTVRHPHTFMNDLEAKLVKELQLGRIPPSPSPATEMILTDPNHPKHIIRWVVNGVPSQ